MLPQSNHDRCMCKSGWVCVCAQQTPTPKTPHIVCEETKTSLTPAISTFRFVCAEHTYTIHGLLDISGFCLFPWVRANLCHASIPSTNTITDKAAAGFGQQRTKTQTCVCLRNRLYCVLWGNVWFVWVWCGWVGVCGYRQCKLFYWIDLAATIGFSFGHFSVKNIWLVGFWVQINTDCGEFFKRFITIRNLKFEHYLYYTAFRLKLIPGYPSINLNGKQ